MLGTASYVLVGAGIEISVGWLAPIPEGVLLWESHLITCRESWLGL